MTSLKDFFNKHEDDIQKGITHKNNIIKRNIVAYMAVNGCSTLAELTQKLHVSVPTMTKLVHELVEEELVVENGKIETTGGRRPNVFGLTNSAIYFAGVNIGRDSIQFVLTDVQNNTIVELDNHEFVLNDSDKCLRQICEMIDNFLNTCGIERSKILGIGVCIAGRVNPDTGRSYMYFTSSDKSLRETIEEYTSVRTLVENDTRARCYAEYCNDNQQGGHNLLYLHLGRGVAIGIVTNGKLYYGKSGFAGEFGHTPFFDNEIICACGKKGCLETEVSGMAIEQKIVHRIEQGVNTILREKYDAGQMIHIDDVVNAAKKDDTLSIELIEEAGEKVGKSIAFLINIFNPETVIIGGNLSKAGEFLMLPLKSATNKFSLNLVYKDTKFRFSQMSENAGALGAAMLIRNRIIGVQ
ncbi:MAG: ROK family protein [Rikenellaceae bacterium]|nr:ROK family protein [Rikenellaceae bacterium]